MKKTASLTNWALFNLFDDNKLLIGTVTSHPDLPHGEELTVSSLVAFDGRMYVAETSNTVYQLEEPADDFKEYLDRNHILLPDLSFRK